MKINSTVTMTFDNEGSRYPVIFLDIDGVLNTFLKVVELSLPLERPCVAVLNQLIEKSGAKVVISSSWRLYYDLEKIREILEEYGFVGEIIGKTPVLKGSERGEEIKTWLQVHGEGAASFVILDDHADMCDIRDHLVRTDANEGFQKHHGLRALEILERDECHD
ncbi:MAG: HAD domain-containing protein [Planctomycetota bacterium]|nr:HAD domain-containing protein [Planctomycetota bacterium]